MSNILRNHFRFYLLTAVVLSIWKTPASSRFVPDNAEGLIMAFGDFDNDKYVDIVVANDGLKSLTLWYYQGKKRSGAGSRLSKGSTISVSEGEDSVIASVVPGDFDGDNDLDLAVFLHDSSMGKEKNWLKTPSSNVL